MGSDSSKLVFSKDKHAEKQSKNKCQSVIVRRQSVNTGRVSQPPTIRVGTSVSFNESLVASEKGSSNNSLQVDRPQILRGRSGSACSERSNSIKGKHPVSIRYRQLIASCFQNPHEVIGRKILKRTVEMRPDFGKFYFSATQEQREELEESIKVLLKKTVCNIDFLDEMKRMAEDFGEKLVYYRSTGFKADFFSCLADATIKECTFLDNAVHPAHQTLSAFSQFITMVFSSVRDGFYNKMRRLRRASNSSFSTWSSGSRKKTSIDSNSNFELALPSRSPSLSDECFTPTVHECDEGYLKPPTMVIARMC